MQKIGPITVTIDMREKCAEALEVLKELQWRVSQISPGVSEEEALRMLLIDVTFDYVKATKNQS